MGRNRYAASWLFKKKSKPEYLMNLHLDPLKVSSKKFSDPLVTAKGEKRAKVAMHGLTTLWFNTGTLCNLACKNCYIESTPKNDRLVYLSHDEVVTYLDEIREQGLPTREIGITGGEPFMNPDIIPIMTSCLERGFDLLVLTNAMRPMMKCDTALIDLNNRFGNKMTLRVSVDHFKPELHEDERGENTWTPMMLGLKWLSDNRFNIDVAGRTRWVEEETELREGFDRFFRENGIGVDAFDHKKLVLFPEMEPGAEVPEITTACWQILDVDPADMMCASSRMVVKHKGDARPSVQACTLLAYDPQFNMGTTLEEAQKPVPLNHVFCSKFCVLGGGACSVKE
jgi:MoaA/NifB/PqqE/SkfB family radical SAM enzyme